MAFSNLFTKLCDVEGAAKDPSVRSGINGQEGSSKRKRHDMQAHPHVKRQHFQPYGAGTSDKGQNKKSRAGHRFNGANNNPGPSVSSEAAHRQNQRTFSNQYHNRGNFKNKRAKKEQRQSKNERYWHAQSGIDDAQPRKPLMSQEFKDQHSLEVDGRLLCIFFLRGRCLKDEECKFEHIEGYNGLIKEACKFYIQGFCLKGKTCPYMHETFPCKFFHAKGKCRRDPCMFSHEPLTDLTRKPLDNFMQRENENIERMLRKKAEEEALSQTENVPETVEENTSVEIVLPTAWPRLYQGSKTAVEEDTLAPDEEPPAHMTKEDNCTPQTERNGEPEAFLPSTLDQPGPVCYSVEAVLGPKLFTPCLYTATKSQQAPLNDPKTTDNLSSDILSAPYSVTNVLKPISATNSSLLRPPPKPSRLVASCQTKDMGSGLILGAKYSGSPSVKERTFEKPPSFHHSAAFRYPNNKTDLKTASKVECESIKAKEEAPNMMIEDGRITTDYNRQYVPLRGRNCQPQKYPTQVQKDNLGECKQDLNQPYFKATPTPSIKNIDNSLNNALLSKQVKPTQEDLKETSHIQNAAENGKECVASPCHKTASRLNSLFSSLTPNVVQTSVFKKSGNTVVQSAQTFESDCSSQKGRSFYCSENKTERTESDASHPAKKDDLFENLTPHFNRTSTVSKSVNETSATQSPAIHNVSKGTTNNKSVKEKAALQGHHTFEKPGCDDQKVNSDSSQKSTPFTENTLQSSSNNSNVSHMQVDNNHRLITPGKSILEGAKRKVDSENTKTPPDKSFHSLFATLAPYSHQISTLCNRVSDNPTGPSTRKRGKSISYRERIIYSSDHERKPSQFTDNTSESTNNIRNDCSETLVCTSAKTNLKCSQKEGLSETSKTPPVKSFQNLFTNLSPVFNQTTVSSSVSDKPAAPGAQKVKKSVSGSRTKSVKNEECSAKNTGLQEASIETLSQDSQTFVCPSACSDLKTKNSEKDIESAETPIKSFQTVFASLTPFVGTTVSDKSNVLRADNVEKSICEGENSDSNQCKSTSGPFKDNVSQSSNCGSSGRHGEVFLEAECTKPLSHNGQKLVSPPALSHLKSENKTDDTDCAKTPGAKSFQNLFTNLTPEVDRTSTDQSQYNESTGKRSRSFNSGFVAARTETLKNPCPHPVTSSAASKGENSDTDSANTPTKSLQSLFAASLGKSALKNNSQSMDSKISHKRRRSSGSDNGESEKEHKKKPSAPENSSSISNAAPASPQDQSNPGPPHSILRSLFQQLRPLEQVEVCVCVKTDICNK